MTRRQGPIEKHPWPETLEAFVVDGVHDPRVHGYEVEGDLAKHYRFADIVYLTLVGELPDERQSRAFEIALSFALPVSVASGPGHATALAGFCGGEPSGVLAAATVTIADDVRDAVFESETLEGDLPPELQATSDEEAASVERLRRLVDGLVDAPLLSRRPRRDIAILAVLRACGLRSPLQLTTALTFARLPCAVAESAPRSSADFIAKYPLDTPPFVYEE